MGRWEGSRDLVTRPHLLFLPLTISSKSVVLKSKLVSESPGRLSPIHRVSDPAGLDGTENLYF